MTHRILLVQLADLGDMILTTPALAALRAAQPDSHLALLTSPHAARVLDDSLVDEVITFDKHYFMPRAMLNPVNWLRIGRLVRQLRREQYDTLVFFHHFTLKRGTFKFALLSYTLGAHNRLGLDNGNGYFLTHRLPDKGFGLKHQAQYWLDLVGLLDAETHPRRARVGTSDEVLPIPAYGARAGMQGVRVVIHAGSGPYTQSRRWDPFKFAKVADHLVESHQAQIVLVGTPDDDNETVKAAMRFSPVDLTGRTSLPQLADLLRSADLFIGADSGITHMAAAVGTPVVAVYGPSNHAAWGPWSPGGQVALVRSQPLCSPCSYVEHSIGLRHGCPALTCMRMVNAQQVIDTATTILDGLPVIETVRASRPKTKRVEVLGLPVDAITYKEWMALIKNWVEQGERCYQVCTTNPEFTMMARSDPNFRNILKRADLCVPDGVGLLWAARRQGIEIPERVTGSDGVPVIAEHAAEYGWSLFLLGAAPGVAEEAAAVLCDRFPGLQIAGTYAGSPAPEEEDDIVRRINDSEADILLVAYGAPNQDKWIARNQPRLNVKMAMGIGGAFDFIAGRVPRAPERMRELGLEWLYRLYKQPWRIRRMMRLPRFLLAVLLAEGKTRL